MNRRQLLGALAGAALATVASRTGFAQSALRLVDDPSDGVALNAGEHAYLRDSSDWHLPEHAELSEEALEEMMLDLVESGASWRKLSIMPTGRIVSLRVDPRSLPWWTRHL